MTTSLDKFISNDEILSYTCIIIGTITIIFLYIVMMKKIDVSIYQIALFEIAFVIFVVSFLLKKKDIYDYDKNDDIKYDLYFYLRISLIIISIICFILYSKYLLIEEEIKISKKKGGGNDFFKKVSTSFYNIKNSVSGLYHKNFSNNTKYLEYLEKQINDLKIDIETVIQIYDKLYKTKLESELNNLFAIKKSKLNKIEADINKIKNKSIKKNQVQPDDFMDNIEEKKIELILLIETIQQSLNIKSIVKTLIDEHNKLVSMRNNILLENQKNKNSLTESLENSGKLMRELKTAKGKNAKTVNDNIKENNNKMEETAKLINNYDKRIEEDLAIKIKKLNNILTILRGKRQQQMSENDLLQSEVNNLSQKQDDISKILSRQPRNNSTIRLEPITTAAARTGTRATARTGTRAAARTGTRATGTGTRATARTGTRATRAAKPDEITEA
jgi:hypothetical protein